MNKQMIRKFERESGLEIYGLGSRREKWEDCMEKFAELIVRECADIADINAHQHRPPGLYVRQYFGVEE